MRLLVDGGGYAAAADAFAEANRVAALQYDALTSKLSGFAAMAGDDATSDDFAAAYDDAAAAAVAAHADLVDALATLGRLTDASLANHTAAESRSIIPGRVFYQGGAVPDHGYVAVLPSRPPSSLGGDPPSLSGIENWILDQVEGFVWPNADTDRLHDAAHVWRTAAESLDQVPTYCRAATRELDTQRSPEIQLAVAATDEVRTTVDALAGEYAVLAGICDDYATGVETQRALILDLLVTTARDAAIVQGIGIVLSSVTAGLTAAGATAINAAKIAAVAPVLLRAVAAIGSLALACASRLRAVLARIGDLARRLARFKVGAAVGKGKPQASALLAKDYLRTLKPGRNSGVREVPDEDALQRVWQTLIRDADEFERPNAPHSAWYRQADGTEIGIRGESHSGGPTIDVFLPTGEKWKVHLP